MDRFAIGSGEGSELEVNVGRVEENPISEVEPNRDGEPLGQAGDVGPVRASSFNTGDGPGPYKREPLPSVAQVLKPMEDGEDEGTRHFSAAQELATGEDLSDWELEFVSLIKKLGKDELLNVLEWREWPAVLSMLIAAGGDSKP